MFVVKRDGHRESVMFDKITSRVRKLCYGLNMQFIDPTLITMKVREIIFRYSWYLKLPFIQIGHVWAVFRCYNQRIG